ncbi:hypothetical protein D3C86_1897820 [compost metagenome]
MDRYQVALPATDLNVIAMNTIETDLQRIQPQFFALADLETVEIVAGTIGQGPPFVQLTVVAGGDNATVANQHRRGFHHGALQQVLQFIKLTHLGQQVLHMRSIYAF